MTRRGPGGVRAGERGPAREGGGSGGLELHGGHFYSDVLVIKTGYFVLFCLSKGKSNKILQKPVVIG